MTTYQGPLKYEVLEVAAMAADDLSRLLHVDRKTAIWMQVALKEDAERYWPPQHRADEKNQPEPIGYIYIKQYSDIKKYNTDIKQYSGGWVYSIAVLYPDDFQGNPKASQRKELLRIKMEQCLLSALDVAGLAP